ncbi:zinc finger CCHC domain-containing protein 7 [Patella vulgata]|uniref:zinc finger CCHC domain-containing protein 7 n=1 Tax=Patella vulgata TaxID=6465 RepID=UPI002180794E|nr:zinc finger CCHC domain-containing protein 7 [Patella vulgata]
MFADSEDDGGPDASSYRTYDIDSLNDSDREELEHALYSQIHFEQHDDWNLENEISDHTNYPVYIPTVNKDIFNVDISPSSSTDKNIDNFPIKTKVPLEILSDEKNILPVEKPNNRKGKVLVKETLSKLKVASVNKLTPTKKIKDAKKVHNQSLKSKNNYNEKEDSKYSLKTSVNARSIKSHQLITGLKNILNSSSASQKNKNKKVIVLSDVEKSESESDEEEVSSASEDEMSSSFMYASDSDSDSSSMCSKTFGRDRVETDIKLNIDDPSDADIDDVIAINSGLSSESDEQNDINKWQVSEQDILGSRPEVFRYYKYDAVKNVRCKNCREKGHLSRDCPKPRVIVCYLCGQRDHMSQACTQPICYNCSKPGHVATDCKDPQYKWFKLCTRCEMPGHQAENCPDLWRRFHLTTTVCDPVKQPIRKNPKKFCCNCGSNKHFGYECNRAPMSTHAQITYPFILYYMIFSGM